MAYVSAAINNLEGGVTEENLRVELDKILNDTDKEDRNKKTEVTTNTDESLNVLFKETLHNYNINSSGNITYKKALDYPTLATQTTSANYGNYVNYNIDYDGDEDTSDDWRIFYNDGECVYLIASDYVYLPEYSNAYSNGGYRSFNLKRIGYSTVDSAIEFLSNTNNWKSLVNENLAKYALGTPDIEMLVESWNQNHNEESIILTENENGYTLEFSGECSINSDSLYQVTISDFPFNATIGMWIASKDINSKIFSLAGGFVSFSTVNGADGFSSAASGASCIGIRPIVCLKPEVMLESGNGTIESPYEIALHN